LVEDYYNDTGFLNFGYWYPQTQTPGEACENLLEVLLARVPDRTGPILDVGCGTGATTQYLTRHYDSRSIAGINISADQLEQCRRAVPQCSFYNMDATRLQFSSSSFRTIISVEAAFHFDTRLDFLRESSRVLRPGGTLVFSDIIFAPDAFIQPPGNRVQGLDEYQENCGRADFADLSVEDVTEFSWVPFAENFAQYLRLSAVRRSIPAAALTQGGRWLWRAAQIIERYVIVCCKKAEK